MTEDIVPQSRVCTSCGKEYPLTFEHFYRNKNNKYGFALICRDCKRAKDQEYHAQHREEHNEASRQRFAVNRDNENAKRRQRRLDNLDSELATQRRYYYEHREQINEKGRQSYRQNKEARLAQARRYHAANLDKIRVAGRTHYKQNQEKITAKKREWRKNNPDQARELDRENYLKYKDKYLAQGRKWAAENPDKVHAIKQRWLDNNPERRRQISRDWAKNHPEQRQNWRANNPDKYRANNKSHKAKRRSQMQQAEGRFTRADLLRLYSEQDGHCAYCAISIFWDIPRDIHVDHIIPLSRGGSNWPDNLALTCEACNLSKADKLYEEWVPARGW